MYLVVPSGRCTFWLNPKQRTNIHALHTPRTEFIHNTASHWACMHCQAIIQRNHSMHNDMAFMKTNCRDYACMRCTAWLALPLQKRTAHVFDALLYPRGQKHIYCISKTRQAFAIYLPARCLATVLWRTPINAVYSIL